MDKFHNSHVLRSPVPSREPSPSSSANSSAPSSRQLSPVARVDSNVSLHSNASRIYSHINAAGRLSAPRALGSPPPTLRLVDSRQSSPTHGEPSLPSALPSKSAAPGRPSRAPRNHISDPGTGLYGASDPAFALDFDPMLVDMPFPTRGRRVSRPNVAQLARTSLHVPGVPSRDSSVDSTSNSNGHRYAAEHEVLDVTASGDSYRFAYIQNKSLPARGRSRRVGLGISASSQGGPSNGNAQKIRYVLYHVINGCHH